jgi:hypothetical protein
VFLTEGIETNFVRTPGDDGLPVLVEHLLLFESGHAEDFIRTLRNLATPGSEICGNQYSATPIAATSRGDDSVAVREVVGTGDDAQVNQIVATRRGNVVEFLFEVGSTSAPPTLDEFAGRADKKLVSHLAPLVSVAAVATPRAN